MRKSIKITLASALAVALVAGSAATAFADAPAKRGARPSTADVPSEEEIAAGYSKTYSTWTSEEEAEKVGAKYEEAKERHEWVLEHQNEFPKKRDGRERPSGTQADAPTKRGTHPSTDSEPVVSEPTEAEVAAGYAKTYSTWTSEEEAEKVGVKYEEAKERHEWVLAHQDELPKKNDGRE